MGDGLRTIRVVSTDTLLLNQAKAAAEVLEGWEIIGLESVDELLEATPTRGDVILIDKFLRGENIYEVCRRLTGQTACRTYLVAEHDNDRGDSIARFCGATGVLHAPLSASRLAEALEQSGGPRPPLPEENRESNKPELPEKLLVGIADETRDDTL
ncbi:MAG: DNA-binding NarL/FixJ family response regulator, partial [Candidatus Paceibacteria bacterium]